MPELESIHWTTELAICGVIAAIALILHIFASHKVAEKAEKRRQREIERIAEKKRA